MSNERRCKGTVAALAVCVALLGTAFVAEAVSIDTHGTYPYAHCAQPTTVTASSNPRACTNKYVMQGTCVQNKSGVAKNYQPSYTVTGVWNGHSHQATETVAVRDMLDFESQTVKGVVKSSCSTDPWLNDVKCRNGRFRWLTQNPGVAPYEAVQIKGPFPLTAGHIDRAAVRQQLLSTVRPNIVFPTQGENVVTHGEVRVVIKVGLPCGMRSLPAESLELELEKQKVTRGPGSWVTSSWVPQAAQPVPPLINGEAFKELSMTAGKWRVRSQVTLPTMGRPGDWREFQVTIGELRVKRPSEMRISRPVFRLPATGSGRKGSGHSQERRIAPVTRKIEPRRSIPLMKVPGGEIVH